LIREITKIPPIEYKGQRDISPFNINFFLLHFSKYGNYYYYFSYSLSPFILWHINLSVAELRNYWTKFHETWWSYRYMFLVDPKVFRFVVKGVKAIFLGVQRGWGLL
jgi:hypothetical protein